MILLWGIEGDQPIELVRQALCDHGSPVLFLDQRQDQQIRIDLEFGSHVEGYIRFGATVVDVRDIDGYYLRPYDFRLLGEEFAAPESPQWIHASAVTDLLLSLADTLDAVVINRPAAMMSNASKPYQAELIRACGFDVPEGVVTTDPQVVKDFHAQHHDVIYKSIGGVRSIVSRLNLEDAARLARVSSCPTLFQERIEGVEYRVHVVRDQIFAAEIESEEIDYRYGPTLIRPSHLPKRVAEACLELAEGLGLLLAGIDLRRSPNGEWFCFEVNTAPAFSCYERADRGISRKLAETLTSKSKFLI